jgi:phosphatidylinositol-3-phosphatase
MKRSLAIFFCILAALASLAGCGGTASSASPSTQSGSSATSGSSSSSSSGGSTAASTQHMVIVVEENKDFTEVIGGASMPYLNSLVPSGALAANYFGVADVSLPNYFTLTAGATITSTDSSPVVSDDNIVRHLASANLTWKVYAEDLPSVGYLGGDTGNYIQHHNPFVYFSDVVSNPSQQSNVVPYSQFAVDLAANAEPNYAFIVPNAIDDGHQCAAGTTCTAADEMVATDKWLSTNVPPLLASPNFSNGLLAIVWDSADVNFANGGGHIPLLLLGSGVKTGTTSQTFYQHPSLLRLSMEYLGLQPTLGDSSSAPDMSDMVVP